MFNRDRRFNNILGTSGGSWWSQTTWYQADDIRSGAGIDGKQLIIDSWVSAGILDGNRNLITAFYEEFPSVNLASLGDLSASLGTCVGNVLEEITDINTKFKDCIITEVGAAGFQTALDRSEFYQHLNDELPLSTQSGLKDRVFKNH